MTDAGGVFGICTPARRYDGRRFRAGGVGEVKPLFR